MVLSTFDQENHDRILKEDSLEKGRQIAKDQLNHLNQLLINDNRMADLIKATNDDKFQEQLLAEYHLLNNNEKHTL
jgi:hypothetical protein